MLKISNIKMPVIHDQAMIEKKAEKILKSKIKYWRIIKKSLDARDKKNIQYVYTLAIDVDREEKYLNYKNIEKWKPFLYSIPKYTGEKMTPVIVGTGPSGLFCGLVLAKAGIPPIFLERGKEVSQRKEDIHLLNQQAILDENSNIQFGEGGAGTFSDGKLTTQIKDSRLGFILEEFASLGNIEELLYETKPHIGSDKLLEILPKLRKKIIALGGEFLFQSTFIDFHHENNQIKEVIYQNKEGKKIAIPANPLILALGHSSRDTVEMLLNKNIPMEPKAFAVGLRIEHSQEFIQKSQFGSFYQSLPPAEYKLTAPLQNGRGAYTFCMCPGGKVVCASSEKQMLAINGMSNYLRNETNANSAILINIRVADFHPLSQLSGIEFQRDLEKKAFALGGGNYKAPVQLVGDFIANKPSVSLDQVYPSYEPGFTLTNLNELFPPYITESLKEGLLLMDKKIQGFATHDAILTGVESRSSAPYRILRNDNLESSMKGLYPIGEGAGYAGGIMSSALDGIKCAESIISKIQKG